MDCGGFFHDAKGLENDNLWITPERILKEEIKGSSVDVTNRNRMNKDMLFVHRISHAFDMLLFLAIGFEEPITRPCVAYMARDTYLLYATVRRTSALYRYVSSYVCVCYVGMFFKRAHAPVRTFTTPTVRTYTGR